MGQSPMRTAAYCRVSTNKTEQLDSYGAQQEFFKDYCQRHGFNLLRIYGDATVIIGLKQNPTYGRRFSPIFLLY